MASNSRVLVTGGRGRLARAVVPAFAASGWDVLAMGREDLDVTKQLDVRHAITEFRPTAVVNLAAWTDVEACEANPAKAHAVNAEAVLHLAEVCGDSSIHLCHVSTNYVFDGEQQVPYRETDPAMPLSVYGTSKLVGDSHIAPESTIARVGWLSGREGACVVRTVLDLAGRNDVPIRFVTDQFGSPTSTSEVARVLVELVEQRLPGLVNVTNDGVASCFELARHVLQCAQGDPDRIEPATTAELFGADAARRPAFSALDGSKLRGLGPVMTSWQDAIARLVAAMLSPTSSPS